MTAVFDLLAYPEVTPLGEPLTREEAVMLRFRSWLSGALADNGLQVRWTRPDGTPQASVLLSAEHGAMIMLGADDSRGAVAVTEAGLGIFLSQHAGRFEVPLASLGQAGVQAALSVRETVDPKTGDYRHDLGLAASFGSVTSESELATVVTARIEPVACLALVHRKPSKDGDAENIFWRGDTLEIHGGDGVARFDGPTGRLLEVDIASLGRITVAEAGSWDEQLAGLRDVSGPNAFRPQAPVSSAIGFWIRAGWPSRWPDARGSSAWVTRPLKRLARLAIWLLPSPLRQQRVGLQRSTPCWQAFSPRGIIAMNCRLCHRRRRIGRQAMRSWPCLPSSRRRHGSGWMRPAGARPGPPASPGWPTPYSVKMELPASRKWPSLWARISPGLWPTCWLPRQCR